MAGAASKFLSHLRRSSLRCSSLCFANPGCYLSSPKLIQGHFHPGSDSGWLLCSQYSFGSNRFFSTGSSDENSELFGIGESTAVRNELCDVSSSGLNGVADEIFGGVIREGSILPVRALISLLDRYHDLTGFPWWFVIVSSTLAMRIALLPALVLQLRKMKRIAEITPKLPPPLPPPFSGRRYLDHFLLFHRERRASGCPSLLWMFLTFSVQVPCFLLWVVTIRMMSLDNHPGFDHGGILWFQNLTEIPCGGLGFIFPLLIGVLHYMNVQISFSSLLARENPYIIDLLGKAYKKYLDLVTLPIICTGFCIPQGSLVYWVTNASLSVVQQIALKHPTLRMKLGLPKEGIIPERGPNFNEIINSKIISFGSDIKQNENSEQDLSPTQLLALSLQEISEGNGDKGISLLKLALAKDPDYISAMIVLGQTLLQRDEPEEASEYLEGAISKLFRASYLTEAEYLQLLLVASQWAGIAYVQQSKHREGIIHLERISLLNEPKEPNAKVYYYEGLVLLASALFKEGKRAEAAKHLRLAAAYDSRYEELLEQCQMENQNLIGDLVKSRRGEY
ncbi:hypothetical protein SAY87_013505 [Trapa incisa]|uniref:ALBINO3-like protein 2, chloroplastic n=1 Tax=Trapa incisa TaxID=236973 RepID=A0AAN7KDH9_9MYRT|nr:hypothetical protein SAY87_013505 [Trapa incisa]